MHPAIPRLLELQTIDQHIAALRAELDAFPKRVREADLKLTGARNAVAAAAKPILMALPSARNSSSTSSSGKSAPRNTANRAGRLKPTKPTKRFSTKSPTPKPKSPKLKTASS